MAVLKKAINRRRKIIEATCEALAHKGHASASMRAIATSLDLSLSTLQYYFPTKEALLSAAVEETIGKHVAEIEGSIASAELPARDLLLFAARKQFATICDPFVSSFFAALWGLSTHDKDVAALLNKVYGADVERYTQLIKAAAPSLPEETCRTRSVMLVALIEGLSLMIAPGRVAADHDNAISAQLEQTVDQLIS